MSQIVREFLSRLEKEEAIFHPRLVEDAYGLAFLTAIKEFDFYYYNLIRHESSDTTSEHFYLMRLAIPRLIEKTLSSIPHFKFPIITFRSDPPLILSALNRVARFGFVEHGKRMAYATLAGECELAKINDSLFEFRLPEILFNYEATESHIENFHRQQRRERRDELINEAFESNGTLAHLDRCFMDNVYVFREHFIGYNAHPDLDDYFFGLAYSDLQDHGAFDTFHYNLTFGGLKYLHYILCVAYFLSLSLKHERFCEALVKKHPETRLRDILTITCEKSEFISSIQTALNHYGPSFSGYSPISFEEATQLYKVLSLGRHNLCLVQRGMMSIPYVIEFSDVALAKSIAGAQLDPSEFVLESLRHNYPCEYEAHQQTREGAMQKALQRLLSETFASLEFRRNTHIRTNGQLLTDIDFVAIERYSATAILFQLKHQDHYGGDIRKRSNRGGRLRRETEAWLEHVNHWLHDTPRERIYTTLQIRKNVQIAHFYTVAIGKHFAHFLAPLASDKSFAYANWVQFYDALVRIKATKTEGRTLADLFAILRVYMSHNVAAPQSLDGSDLYNLDTLSYRIVQRT